ncbi:hypothetical protein FJK98_02285 [Micromonospora sp. HM134]|uniref:hypothetical protein n=1 Tax=Micromonospora sp. HM134 TaxID=2583243 RepID=UPI0011983519|nr:hypothetical protein [Micromonospora sp. HM134]QDY06133.1 hypothetical protein FJK98_02285 [Micromonospora sp. HM134]
MTAAEHFAWAKGRALEYVDLDDPVNAMASLVSDPRKHEGTRAILHDDLLGLFAGEVRLGGVEGARRFIEGLAGPAVTR